MEAKKEINNPLGIEPISKLMRKFAIPSIVAMLVSSFYNIVDQFFIGRTVGTLGNAATNVAFPVSTICVALGLLFGIGGAAAFNIEMGKGNKEKAPFYIGNVVTVNLFNLVADIKPSFIILLLLSFIVIAISNIFVPSLSTKWTLFVPKMMPLFMKSNITPEFTGAMFRLASSVTNIISPIFSYFVVYLGFIGLYSKNDFTIRKCYKMLMPYFIAILILWLFIVFGWYVLKAPIGPNVFPTI